MTLDELKGILPTSKVFKIEFTEEVGYKNSKLGGNYYWKDADGLKDYIFLAQINFSELPENDIFPKKGLLQFFVLNDDCYGLFNETEKDGFKVVYHEDIEGGFEIETDRSIEYSPIYKPNLGMNFEATEEYLSYADYRFENYYSEDLTDEMYDTFDGSGSKILGYPAFTQYDPRDNGGFDDKYDTLLLQLDSDENMMWGDSGVANFFINGEKLRNGDFSDILYNWDCC